MASQRVLLFAIGGSLAESVWKEICRWNDSRTVTSTTEWSPDDWALEARQEIDAFVEKMVASAVTPPILYRSEHIDCWSMGDVYQTALVIQHPDCCRQLCTTAHEVIATWVHSSDQIIPDSDAPPETLWLYNRVNEAIDARRDVAERRLIVFVRSVFAGLWTDDEVAGSLAIVPAWWTLEPATGSPTRGESSPLDR